MKRAVFLLAAAALLLIAYQSVLALVRSHVDDRIEENHGATLPPFTLTDTSGRTWSNDDVEGKALVLNFTRSHCRNCVKEKPAIRAFADELDPNTVQLLSVMTDRVEGFSPKDTEATLAKAAFTHPVVMADAAFVDALHGAGWAHVTPITYFVSPAGRIVSSLRGAQTLESLHAALASVR